MKKAMLASAFIHLGLIAGAWVMLGAQPEANEADAESVSVDIISMDMVPTEPSAVITSSNQTLVSAGEEHEAMEVPEVSEAEPVTEEMAAEVKDTPAEEAVAPPIETGAEASEAEDAASAAVLTAAVDADIQPLEAALPQITSEAAPIVVDAARPAQSDPLDPFRTATISELTPQPPEQKLPETLVKPVEAVKPLREADLTPPVEAVEEATDAAPMPLPRIVRKPVEPTKAQPKPSTEANKQQPSKQASLGNGGNADADALASSQSGGGKGKKDDGGSAAASKYPGLVQARVTRSARYPSKARGKAGEALISFVVGTGGNVSRVALARSSGNAVLDAAAIAAVNRAAPFPPIPEAAGRSNWAFTVPVYFKK